MRLARCVPNRLLEAFFSLACVAELAYLRGPFNSAILTDVSTQQPQGTQRKWQEA